MLRLYGQEINDCRWDADSGTYHSSKLLRKPVVKAFIDNHLYLLGTKWRDIPTLLPQAVLIRTLHQVLHDHVVVVEKPVVIFIGGVVDLV
jgi:hypothetical protein